MLWIGARECLRTEAKLDPRRAAEVFVVFGSLRDVRVHEQRQPRHANATIDHEVMLVAVPLRIAANADGDPSLTQLQRRLGLRGLCTCLRGREHADHHPPPHGIRLSRGRRRANGFRHIALNVGRQTPAASCNHVCCDVVCELLKSRACIE
jgi:hypothetical protein